MIEIRHLRTLVALAESGSLSTAAQRVHLTQSALSHQIKQLEAHYQIRLFDRKSNPLKLSVAGQRLLALAYDVLPRVQAADRDLAKLVSGTTGNLRIALECHTCFDWLMPVMDAFRHNWPEVEMDLVSGFHSHPVALLDEGRADLVVVSEQEVRPDVVYFPLFRFEILAVMANEHPLTAKSRLEAGDFAGEPLITYPVPEDRIDLIRQVLKPAGIEVTRRTAELTIAIMQLVASRRGLAALPSWGLKNYLDYGYVAARPIGRKGLWSDLYAAVRSEHAALAYMQDFLETIRTTCFAELEGLLPIDGAPLSAP